MKTYKFWIQRKRFEAFEAFTVQAVDSHAAIAMLPVDLNYWDFAANPD